ncbi:MAG: hypothetical protein GWP61_08010 [Chloroflexi bacterium]|nr:hypothetical protein [Chloroflexota bacterium]
MRDPEYDSFGPWIIEISELDPPPPLFLPYLTREENPLFSIKIPRKIDRRAAHPGMNLYDYLVTLYQEDFVILKRVGDEVSSEAFFYKEIQHLRHSEHLLKGNLHLAMMGKSYDLPFNTVSADIMRRLAELIRERYTGEAERAATVGDKGIPEDNLSYYFSRLLAQEKVLNPPFQVLASQTETPVGSYETRPLHKLLFGIISKRLLESLHLSDGRELKIISRGKIYKYKGQSVYGIEVCTIPTSKIIGITWEPDPKNTAVLKLILQTAGGTLTFAFIRDNPSLRSYTRFLSAALGLPEGSNAKIQP